MNKTQIAEQFRKALQMFCQTLTNEEAMEIATIYPSWETNKKYTINTIVSYGLNSVKDPQLYRCVQEHTSQETWTPDISFSLWSVIGLAPDAIPIWSQPIGAHDAYNIGDKVHYPNAEGPIYISNIDSNIWEPGVYGWELM